MISDETTNLSELKAEVKKFCDDRDWDQFHNARDLTSALIIEVAELLEPFRWKNLDEVEEIMKNPEKREEISLPQKPEVKKEVPAKWEAQEKIEDLQPELAGKYERRQRMSAEKEEIKKRLFGKKVEVKTPFEKLPKTSKKSPFEELDKLSKTKKSKSEFDKLSELTKKRSK